ncbi:MAG: 50S ribosomal protein L30 [Deltaproteobacteria bacterium]|nr:50S ribosomal protein L30 [Deltaproteobacteria bacterium]
MDGKRIQVELVRSGIGCPPDQRQTLRGLGLTRRMRKVELADTPAIRGMIRKVAHLVRVEPAPGGEG